MEKIFQNKVAIVTGATSGIGRASAIAFAQAGAKVVVSGRREKEGQETVDLLKKAGGEGMFVKTDVTQESQVETLVKKTVDTYGRLDIAFNNAGIGGGNFGALSELTAEDYDRTFDINVKGLFLSLKYE